VAASMAAAVSTAAAVADPADRDDEEAGQRCPAFFMSAADRLSAK